MSLRYPKHKHRWAWCGYYYDGKDEYKCKDCGKRKKV